MDACAQCWNHCQGQTQNTQTLSRLMKTQCFTLSGMSFRQRANSLANRQHLLVSFDGSRPIHQARRLSESWMTDNGWRTNRAPRKHALPILCLPLAKTNKHMGHLEVQSPFMMGNQICPVCAAGVSPVISPCTCSVQGASDLLW